LNEIKVNLKILKTKKFELGDSRKSRSAFARPNPRAPGFASERQPLDEERSDFRQAEANKQSHGRQRTRKNLVFHNNLFIYHTH
jgi:hypothetical protein